MTLDSKPDIYSIIVDMNGRLGQSLQMGADTKDSVEKIKEVQAKSVTEQTQYHALLQEHIRDHIELKSAVSNHDARIKTLEDRELERKGAIKLFVVMGSAVGAVFGFIISNLNNIKSWFGF